MFMNLLTVIAVVSNVAFVWPQAVRLMRTRDFDGMSPGGWTISIVIFTVWAVFAGITRYWALLIANASCLAAAILILLIGTAAGWSRNYVVLAGSGVLAAVVGEVVAPVAMAVLMTVSGVALRLPQLAALLRSSVVDGVSQATWWLSATTTGSWFVISLDRGSHPVIVASGSASATSVVILAVLYWRRARIPLTRWGSVLRD